MMNFDSIRDCYDRTLYISPSATATLHRVPSEKALRGVLYEVYAQTGMGETTTTIETMIEWLEGHPSSDARVLAKYSRERLAELRSAPPTKGA